MPLFGGGILSLLITVLLCVHVVRTNQPIYWILILLMIPVLGNLVYIVAVLAPELAGGARTRRLGVAARDALDPTGEYRRAKTAADEAPTVHNQMRLAAAAASLGRHAEAEALYAQAAQGIHANDPALLLGRANALIELGRGAEALPLLDKLAEEQSSARSAVTALAQARALEAIGRAAEADAAYQFAVGRLPGLEGLARYSAFLARSGRRQEAEDNLAEIDRRLARANPQFRREGRAWRDLAAQALAKA
ncbi:MAG TPA: tetratricopeptide repeat protein [Caulobacteraceae bacterium]|nr:tetratricopeptide repeat protein [Caulobacteraceae bacterium]